MSQCTLYLLAGLFAARCSYVGRPQSAASHSSGFELPLSQAPWHKSSNPIDDGSRNILGFRYVAFFTSPSTFKQFWIGDDHKRHKKVMNPAFDISRLRSFLPLFQKSASMVITPKYLPIRLSHLGAARRKVEGRNQNQWPNARRHDLDFPSHAW